MNAAQLITQAEYARRRGVAKSAVAKAVSEKRITLIDGKIDPEFADFQWARNTRARADSGQPGGQPVNPADSRPADQPGGQMRSQARSTSSDHANHADQRQQPTAPGQLTAAPGNSAPSPSDGARPLSEPETLSGYSVDRARREKYEADLAQMKLLELQGDLVRVVEVRAEMGKAIGQLRMNALQLAARLSPLLAAESDQGKVHAMIDAEIRTLLSSVALAD